MTPAPAFALLHGGGHGGWVWEELGRALETRGAAVLALDVPGCGVKRDRETLELGVEAVADELLADIEAAGLSDVVLVGHSQAGTMLPVLAARQSPGLFRRLVYLSCCAPLPGQSVLDMMGGGVQGANPDEVGWPLDPNLHGREVQRPIMFCNDMDGDQARAFLARLDQDSWPMAVTYAVHWTYEHLKDVPSTYVVCERDGILPPVWQERFAERLQVGRVVRLDAGHQAMNTRPEELAELLLAEARL
ncbi:alpha/beta fold hydrolase [Caulobacter soli]|uniref:alpha/beta fold hydrolase n=1 Tax=Caulobacter soli TaxID=2708539 RepID=UPI0013ECD5C9|nr:alpha/beta fold hydrolase [Caulobacter soli]